MDWTWLTALIGGPAGAALLGWLGRRRLERANLWMRRRLAAEQGLATCQEELENQAASFARQEAGLMREIAQRERERDNLVSALKQLADAVDVVNRSRNAGLLTPSLPAPERFRPSSSPGRTKPPNRATRQSRSRPTAPVSSGTSSKAKHDDSAA